MDGIWPTIKRFGAGAVWAGLCLLATARLAGAGEADDVDGLLGRLDAVNAEIESTMRDIDRRQGLLPPESREEYCARLLSLDKNAVVTVSGDFRATYAYSRSNFVDRAFADPFAAPQVLGKARIANLGLTRERLGFDIEMGDRWRAFVEFNLSGDSGPYEVRETLNPNGGAFPPTAAYPSYRDDPYGMVGEAYLELLKAGHSGFGLKVGRMELPFGVAAKPDLFAQSLLDAPDLTGSYLMDPLGRTDSPRLPHASAMLDPVMAAMISYELRDIIRFEAALFQENRRWATHVMRDAAVNYARYVERDSAYRSYQIGASFLPLEGWELSLAFRNRYDKGRGVDYWSNSPYRGDFRDNLAAVGRDPRWNNNGQWSDAGTGEAFGSTRSEQAFVAGLALSVPHTKLSLYLEYAHGWNQGFNRHVRSDDVNFGLSYRLTPRLTLHGENEWLRVKDRSWMVGNGAGGWLRDVRANTILRNLLALEYELMDGLTLEAGWQYENWHFRSSFGGPGMESVRKTLTSNLFYMGTRFRF